MNGHWLVGAIGAGVVAAMAVAGVGCLRANGEFEGEASSALRVRAISTHPDRVSGGDVLVEVWAPEHSDDARIVATLDGRDVSAAFRVSTRPDVWIGLVTGLAVGTNNLEIDGSPWRTSDASLELTNYPMTGPIVSGPHVEPFVCQTSEFELPDGSTLGPPLDDDCSVTTRVQYVYMPGGGSEFQPLTSTVALPDDVSMTATSHGQSVPFVVRVETGTMNRGIYQNVVLHDPTSDPAPTPFSPPSGWNRRLIAVHGSGCTGGWYQQGSALGVNPLSAANTLRLAEGYAIFTNTLNHPSNSCNPFLAGETTMMGKEHFIETFGVPDFTISMGGSGGAYTSLQVGDALPGLFDGVLITATFPDALSIAMAGLDAHLLTHYSASTSPGALTDEQQVAISGFHGVQAMVDMANQAHRTDPVPGRSDIDGYASAQWRDVVPKSARYHPTTNPKGARPTVFDVSRNVYGENPETGFALRPYDNVGVQYGLSALNEGVISVEEFLDLNERIGGYDEDANYVSSRTVGDEGALHRAYQAGVTLGGGGGLASIPVFDAGRYNEAGRYHYQWFHFAVRERMKKENGRADNHLMWRGPVPPEESWDVMVSWVAAIAADPSEGSDWDRMMRNRPTRAVDGCWIEENEGIQARFLAEPQTFSDHPDSECNRIYPSYSFTRHSAGGPLDGNVLRCQLKPIDYTDYAVSLNADHVQRLRAIYPEGVCDWSKSGVGQVSVVPWASFGPAPQNRIFVREE